MDKAAEKLLHYRKLIRKSKIEVKGEEAPSCCRRCLYFRPEFKYRSCLFTRCHYQISRKIFCNRYQNKRISEKQGDKYV